MKRCVIIALSVFFMLTSAAAATERVFHIGRPTTEVKKEYERLYPIAVYLAEYLKDYGITGGDVRVDGKNSVTATCDMLQNGQVDLVLETPFTALRLIRQGGAVPLLIIKREGVTEYRSFLFARKDSGISTLDDLKGKVVVFEDPGSTSAYHLPRKALEEAGLDLLSLPSAGAGVPEGKTGYIFAGSELNTSSWVFFKRADAGALSNLDWDSPDENPEAFRREMRIIHETETVPRMLVMARPGLSPELMEAVTAVFLHMHETEAGQEALKNYKMNRFYRIEDRETYVNRLEQRLEHIGE